MHALIKPLAAPSGPWVDLAPRTASAVVLLPLAVACVWFGGAPWSALVTAGAAVLLVEWTMMCRTGQVGWRLQLAGLVYLLLAAASLVWLRAGGAPGRSDVLFLLGVVWASDIGGYVIGRWCGGPRLAPLISPGKTWSCTIGGLLCGMAAGLALSAIWPHGALGAAATLGLLIGAAGQAGDLLESTAKRRCGVKDSGALIPGHGGLLDRMDAVLLAALVMALLGLAHGRGIVLWT